MSKGNMLLGQARGKVGDVVFFVRNGIQQTRPRNREPKNPRTISQMYQRVKLAAVVGFYKRQASFFRFALKKSQKESYYNAFVRYNINLSPYLTREQAANGISIPAPYVIADGNMPRIYVTDANITNPQTLDITTSIPSSIVTWGDMRRAYDLVQGDMLSLVVFNSPDDDLDPTKRIVVQHRFDALSENMPIGYDMVGTEWSTDGERVTIAVNAPYFALIEFFATGSAIVLSRNNGSVDCSYSKLFLDANATFNYNEFRTEAQRELAALSYGEEEKSVLDPKQFEGNYVDMAELYSDEACTQKLSNLSLPADTGRAFYVKSPLYANTRSVSAVTISGDISGISVGKETDDFFTINTSSVASGSGTVLIQFYGDNDNVITTAVLSVNITE